MLDAGGGKVYLMSHRGQYLAIRETQDWGSALALNFQVDVLQVLNARREQLQRPLPLSSAR